MIYSSTSYILLLAYNIPLTICGCMNLTVCQLKNIIGILNNGSFLYVEKLVLLCSMLFQCNFNSAAQITNTKGLLCFVFAAVHVLVFYKLRSRLMDMVCFCSRPLYSSEEDIQPQIFRILSFKCKLVLYHVENRKPVALSHTQRSQEGHLAMLLCHDHDSLNSSSLLMVPLLLWTNC